jgi:hypothetical protein
LHLFWSFLADKKGIGAPSIYVRFPPVGLFLFRVTNVLPRRPPVGGAFFFDGGISIHYGNIIGLVAFPPSWADAKMDTQADDFRHSGELSGPKLGRADLLFAGTVVAIVAGWILGAVLLTW